MAAMKADKFKNILLKILKSIGWFLLGVILLLIGLVAVLYSLLFWSTVTPWGRRRVAARRRMVGLEPPADVVEERPLDDGLP